MGIDKNLQDVLLYIQSQPAHRRVLRGSDEFTQCRVPGQDFFAVAEKSFLCISISEEDQQWMLGEIL